MSKYNMKKYVTETIEKDIFEVSM